jgi:uncharacterized protein with NRDE domain
MCLILLAWRARADYPLVLAANRDEFYSRPTAPAQFWADRPEILAGRDLEKGGTWLAIGPNGRLAAVTNYRDGRAPRLGRRSRGELVSAFVTGTAPPLGYLESLAPIQSEFDGFNLLVGSLWDGIAYFSNRTGAPQPLAPGVHGLSNHLLNSAWPKVERGKAGLLDLLAAPVDRLESALFDLLEDQTAPAEHLLPDTGVGREWERTLATAFIRAPGYGTRCTTVVLADATGGVRFIEHTHAVDGQPAQRRTFSFQARPISQAAAT